MSIRKQLLISFMASLFILVFTLSILLRDSITVTVIVTFNIFGAFNAIQIYRLLHNDNDKNVRLNIKEPSYSKKKKAIIIVAILSILILIGWLLGVITL